MQLEKYASNQAMRLIAMLALMAIPCLPYAVELTSAQEKGLEIALEADRRDSGFQDSSANLTMVLQTPDSTEIRREMRQLTLEIEDDGDKSIMVFDRPRDLKGTAILTFTYKEGSDDQWLYLPALKRVKRISSADKSGPFMGSEFAYEDLSSTEVEKYSYTYLRDEILDGENCYVVERIPADENSGYTRQVTWIDQTEYRMRRIDYYDRKGELVKTMKLSEYQQYLDAYWRPSLTTMLNHQNGKSTVLIFSDYVFQSGFGDAAFSREALSRMR